MQTFLPYSCFDNCAASLDPKRLGKQRVEAKQIIQTLELGPKSWFSPSRKREKLRPWRLSDNNYLELRNSIFDDYKLTTTPWYNHPAVQMWKGFEFQLAHYGLACCFEFQSRGYTDNLKSFFLSRTIKYHTSQKARFDNGFWLDGELQRSHRSNLIRKDPTYYKRQFPCTAENLPYIWPTKYRRFSHLYEN